MSGIKLNQVHGVSTQLLGDTPLDFLCNLGGPSVLHIAGKSSAKCRVVVTLLHGNEPSGLKAIHHLLSNGFVPTYDAKVIVASVVASLTEPVFTHRMLPSKRDLNRCFSSQGKDLQSQLALAIHQQIKDFSPEAVVDIHNTSGSGPSFAVTIDKSADHKALASHFTHRLVSTNIRLGSIMEQDYGCPIVTIEAGGAQDSAADVTAMNGIVSFLSASSVFTQLQSLELLDTPRRFELAELSSLCFDTKSRESVDVTFRQDIESYNFKTVEAGTFLAWVNNSEMRHFKLDQCQDLLHLYFKIEQGKLYTKERLILFMITTHEGIAKSDCLFYFAKPSTGL